MEKRIIKNKVWGSEEWIVNNNLYCGKILNLIKDCSCSLHYHKIKDETFYILYGTVLLEYGNKSKLLKSGDSIRIKPNTIHRFTGQENSKIIEFSTKHLESDSYRIEKSKKGK